jgi:hypothetical protein
MTGASDPHPKLGEWLTYKAAGERLGLPRSAVAAQADRHGWPRRLSDETGEEEILLAPTARPEMPQEARPASVPSPVPPDTGQSARVARDLIQTALERHVVQEREARRRASQGHADVLRDHLATARLELARLQLKTGTKRARLEAAVARVKDLQSKLDALQKKPSRAWW